MNNTWFDFGEHFESIDWMNSLPKGYLTQKVDQNHSTVKINNQNGTIEIIVAPRDNRAGGDILIVILDENLTLLEYIVERIEPGPE